MSSLDKPTVIPPFAPDANSGAIDIEIRVFKRKRVRITAVGFLVALALSLSVNYLRPAVYRATALLEIEPPTAQTGTPMVILLGKERERLMSESIARELDDRLYGSLGGGVGTPLTPGIDGTLSAEIAPNTHIVKLSAEGGDPSILPVIVNTWSEVYQARLSATQRDSTEETRSTLEAQFVEFEARVAEKRNEIGAFRRKHDIVSDDMARNRAPARFQEVSEALAKAREDQIVAAAELNSFR